MKRVSETGRRMLAGMLALFMVLTSVWGTDMTVMAAEQTAEASSAVGDVDTTTVEDGDTTTVEDGETTTVEDGETTTVEDGETTTVEDGDTTTAEDGDTTTVEDGDTTTAEDGDTTTVEDGDTTTVEDEEAEPTIERKLQSSVMSTTEEYHFFVTLYDAVSGGSRIAADGKVDCDTTVTLKSTVDADTQDKITDTYYYARYKISVDDQVKKNEVVAAGLTKYASVQICSITATGSDGTSYEGKTVTCEVKFYATSDNASKDEGELAVNTISFTYRTKAPEAPEISLADAAGNKLTPAEGSDTVSVGYGAPVTVTFDMGENKEDDCTYTYYYTTDGSTPVVSDGTDEEDSTASADPDDGSVSTADVTCSCNGTFTLTSENAEGETVTIKAVAVRTTPEGAGSGGSTTSQTATEAKVTFGARAAAPAVTLTSSDTTLGSEGVLNPNGESDVRTTYGSKVTVEIGSMEKSKKIWYTTDGSDPADTKNTARKSFTNTKTFTLSGGSGTSLTVKTYAEMKDGGVSHTATYTVTWATKLATPIIKLNKKYADNCATDVTFTLVGGDGKEIDPTAIEGVTYEYTVDCRNPITDQGAFKQTYAVGGAQVGFPNMDTDGAIMVYAYAKSDDQTKYADSELAWNLVVFKAKSVDMSVVTELGNTDLYSIKVTDTSHGDENVTLTKSADGGYAFSAPNDATLKVEVAAVAGCTLKQVSVTNSTGVNDQTIKSNKATFTVKAADGLSINVWTYDDQNLKDWRVSAGNDQVIPSSTDTYAVSPRAEYQIYHGDDAKLTATAIGEVQLYVGSTLYGDAVQAGETKPYENGTKLAVSKDGENGSSKVTFTPGTALAGKTVKLVIRMSGVTDVGGPTTYYQAKTLTFKVGNILKSVTVTGVKNDTLTQEVGTTKEYALKLNPSGTADEIGAFVTWKKGEFLGYDPDMVRITEAGKLQIASSSMTDTLMKAFNDNGRTVVIYNKTSLAAQNKTMFDFVEGLDLDSDLVSEDNDVLASFKLKLSAPSWLDNKPIVKLAGATDDTLYLNLTAPKGIAGADSGSYYWYEISYTQKDVTEGTSNIGTKYVSAAGDTSAVPLEVLTDSGKTPGAATFMVTVKLVQVTDSGDYSEGTQISEEKILWTGTGVNTLTCKTKAAYYADKITLKKGTTTIYSGQQSVQAATISFGTNTTYLSGATVEVLGGSWDSNAQATDKITASIDPANMTSQKVIVSVGRNVAPGKYTVRVTAPAAENGKAATADLAITVVAGIDSFTAKVNGGSAIYKAANKAATATIGISYETYNKTYKPKSAKFTYVVGRMNGDSFVEDANVLTYTDKKDKTYPAVTVKNGKITINKNYEVRPVEDSVNPNTFAVKVTAADYAGNEAASIVQNITVTSEETKLSQIVIVKDGTVYVSKNNQEIEAETLDGAKVYVVNSTTHIDENWSLDGDVFKTLQNTPGTGDEGTSETSSQVTPLCSSDYALSVSGKGVSINDDGILSVNSIGSGVTLKATANDGSKNSVSLKIKKLTYSALDQNKVKVQYHVAKHGDTGEAQHESDARYLNNDDEDAKKLTFKKASSTDTATAKIGDEVVLTIMSADSESNTYKAVDKWNQCSVSVSGGAKLLNALEGGSDYSNNQCIRVLLTGKTSKVTLNVAGKKTVYNIALSDENTQLTAPKVAGSKTSLIVGDTQEQTLTFKVTDVKYKNPDTKVSNLVLGDLMGNNITVGYRAADAKSQALLNDGIVIKKVSYDKDNAVITLTTEANGVTKAGSAKLQFYFTDGTNETTLTGAVTIKSVAMKKSFKVSGTKYTVTKAENLAAITYKGSSVRSVVVTDVSNANKKGTFNHFTSYFGIVDDTRYIKLKSIEAIDKSNLEGYVTVKVTYLDDSTQEFETKITMNVKEASAKASLYKVSNVVATKSTTTSSDLLSMPIHVTLDGQEQQVIRKNYSGMKMEYAVYSDPDCTSIVDGVNVHYRTTGDDDPKYLDLKLNKVADDWKGTTKTVYIPVRMVDALKDTVLAVKVQIKDWTKEKVPTPVITVTGQSTGSGGAYSANITLGTESPDEVQLYYAAYRESVFNTNGVVKVSSYDELSNVAAYKSYMNGLSSGSVITTGEGWKEIDEGTLFTNESCANLENVLRLEGSKNGAEGAGYCIYAIACCPGYKDSAVKACHFRGDSVGGYVDNNPNVFPVPSN